MRKMLLPVLLIFLRPAYSQQHPKNKTLTLPEAIEFIRPSVVQISVRFASPSGAALPPQLQSTYTLGSGFLISRDGYVVTARHVVQSFRSITVQGQKILVVGFASLNFENYKSGNSRISSRSNFRFITCEIADEDIRHDLALLKLDRDAFKSEMIVATTPKEKFGFPQRVAILSSEVRPRDGEAIAISGYPLSQTVLVTTSGTLASSWPEDERPMDMSPGASFSMPDVSDYYIGDVRANFGNSGGPVYSIDQGKVIGLCDAYDPTPVTYGDGNHEAVVIENRPLTVNSGLSIIIPVGYVIDLLKKNKVK